MQQPAHSGVATNWGHYGEGGKELLFWKANLKTDPGGVMLQKEAMLLKKLEHVNVIKFKRIDQVKEGTRKMWIEGVDGWNLNELREKVKVMDEEMIGGIVKQIVDGLVHMHERGVMHRDIKGSNVMVDKQGVVKIIDFGLATDEGTSQKGCGTPGHVAPEIARGEVYNNKVDVYSLGCTVVMMLNPRKPDQLSPELQDFLMKTLENDPEKRLSSEALMNHAFVKNGKVGSGFPLAQTDPDPVPKPNRWIRLTIAILLLSILLGIFTSSSDASQAHTVGLINIDGSWSLPDASHFLKRPDVINDIKNQIIPKSRNDTTLTVIKGFGGKGKRTVSAILAADSEIHQAFPDGVLWLRLGVDMNEDKLIEKQDMVLSALSDVHNVHVDRTIRSTAFGRSRISSVLKDKQVLFVLDDVWKKDDVDTLLGQSYARASVLIATPKDPLIKSAQPYSLQLLNETESMELLRTFDRSHRHENSMRRVARFCNGHPLALHVSGSHATLDDGDPKWDVVADVLENEDLATLGRDDNEENARVWRAVFTSIKDLGDLQESMLSLAVLPAGEPIPVFVLSVIWDKSESEVNQIVRELKRTGLVSPIGLKQMNPLHDVIRGYIRQHVMRNGSIDGTVQTKRLQEKHQQLLFKFKKSLGVEEWHELYQKTIYLPHRLGWHHIEGGMVREWCDVLLSFRYLDARVRGGEGVSGLLRDLIVGKNGLIGHEEIEKDVKEAIDQVERAVGASMDILLDDPVQLAGQLAGRLNSTTNDRLRQLLVDAFRLAPAPTEIASGSLIPLQTCLESHGAKRVMDGGGGKVKAVGWVEPFHEDAPWHAVSVTIKGLVRQWSIVEGECVGEHRLMNSGYVTKVSIVPVSESVIVSAVFRKGEVVTLDLFSGRRTVLRQKDGKESHHRSIAASAHNGTLLVVVGDHTGLVTMWRQEIGSGQFDSRKWIAHEGANRVRVGVSVTSSGGIAVVSAGYQMDHYKFSAKPDHAPLLLWDGSNLQAQPQHLLPTSTKPFIPEEIAIAAIGESVRVALAFTRDKFGPATIIAWPSISASAIGPDVVLPTFSGSLKDPYSLAFNSDGTILSGAFLNNGGVIWKWTDSGPAFSHLAVDSLYSLAPLDKNVLIGCGSDVELWNASTSVNAMGQVGSRSVQIVSTAEAFVVCGLSDHQNKSHPCLFHSPPLLNFGELVRIESQSHTTNDGPPLGLNGMSDAISNDGKWVAEGDYDGWVSLWHASDHVTLVEEWQIEGAGHCYSLEFVSLGQQMVLVAGFWSGQILSWKVGDDGQRSEERELHGRVNDSHLTSISVTVVGDELVIVSGWDSGDVKVRRGVEWAMIEPVERKPEQRRMNVVLSRDGRFYVFGKFVFRSDSRESRSIGVRGKAAFSPDCRYLAIFTDTDVTVFEQPTSGDWVADPPLRQWQLSVKVAALTWRPTITNPPELICLTSSRSLIQLALSGMINQS